MRGRVAITYPTPKLIELKKEDQKKLRETVEMMTQKQVNAILRRQTFITAEGTKGSNGEDKDLNKERLKNKLEEAKTKNKTFQLFVRMLGIEKDPKLHAIRESNPLNKILVP